MIIGGELSISCLTSQRVRLTAQLLRVVAAAETQDCSQYVLQQAEPDQASKFIVRLPQTGTYKLQACLLDVLYRAPAAKQ